MRATTNVHIDNLLALIDAVLADNDYAVPAATPGGTSNAAPEEEAEQLTHAWSEFREGGAR